ncbi:hypothetical protein MASR2M66_26020 [Chloroflexota bacterium]
MDYKARFYSPYLNHFIQPDTIIPGLFDSQAWNRYSYVYNRPINFNDPTGHCPICLAVVILAIPFLLAGDTPQGNPDVAVIEEINNASDNSVEDLANLFISDSLTGDSPQERLNAILNGTRNGTGLYFSETFDDKGFKMEFKDPNAGSRNQVGHFLSAASLANKTYGNPVAEYAALSLIIDHEMYPDPTNINFAAFLKQGWSGLSNNLHQHFLTGEEENFKIIMTASKNGNGNSIEDLRLSYQGWIFGRSVKNGTIKTRDDAGKWITLHLAE